MLGDLVEVFSLQKSDVCLGAWPTSARSWTTSMPIDLCWVSSSRLPPIPKFTSPSTGAAAGPRRPQGEPRTGARKKPIRRSRLGATRAEGSYRCRNGQVQCYIFGILPSIIELKPQAQAVWFFITPEAHPRGPSCGRPFFRIHQHWCAKTAPLPSRA